MKNDIHMNFNTLTGKYFMLSLSICFFCSVSLPRVLFKVFLLGRNIKTRNNPKERLIIILSKRTRYDESSKKIQKVRNNILMSQKRIDSTNQVIFAAASLTLFQESTKLG